MRSKISALQQKCNGRAFLCYFLFYLYGNRFKWILSFFITLSHHSISLPLSLFDFCFLLFSRSLQNETFLWWNQQQELSCFSVYLAIWKQMWARNVHTSMKKNHVRIKCATRNLLHNNYHRNQKAKHSSFIRSFILLCYVLLCTLWPCLLNICLKVLGMLTHQYYIEINTTQYKKKQNHKQNNPTNGHRNLTNMWIEYILYQLQQGFAQLVQMNFMLLL